MAEAVEPEARGEGGADVVSAGRLAGVTPSAPKGSGASANDSGTCVTNSGSGTGTQQASGDGGGAPRTLGREHRGCTGGRRGRSCGGAGEGAGGAEGLPCEK